jgi:hypothetical protein
MLVYYYLVDLNTLSTIDFKPCIAMHLSDIQNQQNTYKPKSAVFSWWVSSGAIPPP